MKRTIICLMLALLCVVSADAAKKAKNDGMVKFTLYGADVQVHFDAKKRVKVKKGTDEEIEKCLSWLADAISETEKDCQRTKQELNLCDWAYVKMLDKLSRTALGNTNEATLLMTSLMQTSGYDIRLTRDEKGQIRMLYLTDAFIYHHLFYSIDKKNYFMYGDTLTGQSQKILDVKFPEGKPVDLRYQGEMNLPVQLTEPRTLTSIKNPDFTFTVQVNKNLVDFYGDMPSFTINNDSMTRWTLMANRPLDKHLQNTLVKQMKQKLAGKSQQEQVQQILWWMHGNIDLEKTNPNQNSFLFAYDEEIWGNDRAFYPVETLFYPYCDTEDRSILLSRLVRDVVGLDVVFVYYPGHTAIAVCFTDAEVKGDYVVLEGRHYVICDPTYIGGLVGETMPMVKGEKTTIKKLER